MPAKLQQRVHNLSRLTGILLLSLLTGACSVVEKTLDEFRKPTASVQAVNLSQLSMDSATLLFDLAIDNPNAIPIKSDGLDYRLSVNQQSLVAIERTRQPVDLPARGRGQLSVPVTLKFSDLYQMASSFRGRNAVDYAMELGVYFDLPLLGEFRVPVTYADQLPIPQLPKISFAGVNLENVSLSGASIMLNLDIENGNSFGLDMSQLAYQISANGTALGRGEVESISMPGNNRTRLTMPLELRFDQLGTTMYRLLSGNEPVNVSFTGGVDLLPQLGAWQPERLNINLKRQLAK